jgi:flagellar hook-associated protein 1 FlgK
MAVSPLMSMGVNAMAASYAALQTTGHNIANANVGGYSRQSVELATAPGQYTGAGFFGRGVEVSTVRRAHDSFLTNEANNSKALAAMDSAVLTQLRSLERAFQNGEGSIGDSISQLFAAFSDLSSSPDDLSARQVVLARAKDLAAGFKTAASAFDSVQIGVNAALDASVARVNNLAANIAKINQQIASTQGLGHEPNDLLDQRELLISQLSEQVQVSRIGATDGSVSLFVGGGQSLVLGEVATPLQTTQVQDPGNPTKSIAALAIVPGGRLDAGGNVVGGTPLALDEQSLGSGTMRGLLDFQNNDFAAARKSVDDLATALGTAFNAQQGAGYDLAQAQGTDMFQFDLDNPAATLKVVLTDPAQIAAADAPERGNNGNALAMLRLQDMALVGNLKLNDAWINATAKVGVRVQSAATSAGLSGAASEQAEQLRSSQSGVNLDEEAANLIKFQQSYQAAAKVLQVAQTLFDTLLQTAGR